jgi:uracil-DNA glycosylase
MKTISIQPAFDTWREAARRALREGYKPEELDLQDAASTVEPSLFGDSPDGPTGTPVPKPHATENFLNSAAEVSAHRNPARWNLLYRVLYRLQENRHLLEIETDADVSEMLRLRSQVRRDLHKMHAFVRFRKVELEGAVADGQVGETRNTTLGGINRTTGYWR